MERISNLERTYVSQALDNAFATSLNSVFNNRLEQAFAKRFNAPYAIGHCNGTATMHTALAALGVQPGDEVIVPPLTMSSTSLAVLHNSSIPVFADVDSRTFNISPEAIEKAITPRTKAIITVALYGLPPDYDAIPAICKKHKLALIEDNAECFLGTYRGKPAGEFGDFASFSFQASKHLATGEGGMLLCRDEALADNARRFSCLGYAGVSAKQGKITRQDIQNPRYARHVSLGFNYRMSELQAAAACAQLERAEALVGQRIKVAALFDQALNTTDLLQRQAQPEGCVNSYWSYSCALQTDRPETEWYRFRDLFLQNGGDGFYAAWLLSYNEPLFRNTVQHRSGVWQKYEPGLCPTAEHLQQRMVQLKTNYWDIAEAERQAEILAKTIKQF
jgi:perosamine synthetase